MNSPLTSLKWAVSILALALPLVGTTSIAHADPPKAAVGAVNPSIIAFPSLRTQIRASAKQAGVYPTGSYPSLRLQHQADGTVHATVMTRTTFGGGGAPLPHAQRLPNAVATFKVQQLPDGQLASGVKGQGGKVWQQLYRLFEAAPTAKK
jgi:hypothetical protein